jgi:hypothetical protein
MKVSFFDGNFHAFGKTGYGLVTEKNGTSR